MRLEIRYLHNRGVRLSLTYTHLVEFPVHYAGLLLEVFHINHLFTENLLY